MTTGSNNLILGSDSDPSSATASNQIVLGYNTTGKGDNTVTLGNEGVTAVYAAEDAGAVIYAAGLNLDGVTISANATELNYVDGVTSSIQDQLDLSLIHI